MAVSSPFFPAIHHPSAFSLVPVTWPGTAGITVSIMNEGEGAAPAHSLLFSGLSNMFPKNIHDGSSQIT